MLPDYLWACSFAVLFVQLPVCFPACIHARLILSVCCLSVSLKSADSRHAHAHKISTLRDKTTFSTAYFSIPFSSSKGADTCTDHVLLQTQRTDGENDTEGAHMNKDVACTNKTRVQHDLARRKLHWASLTMGTQGRQKSVQDTDFMPAPRRGGRPCDRHSPGVCCSNGVQ